MLTEGDPAINGVTADPSTHQRSLLQAVISKAGGDPVLFKRAIQKVVVRFPAQSPPPDDITVRYVYIRANQRLDPVTKLNLTSSSSLAKVLDEAYQISKTMRDQFVAQDHLVLALIKDPSIAALLKDAGLNAATIKTAVEQLRGNRRVESKSAEQGFDALAKYAIDLTKMAEDGKLDPVIGRVRSSDLVDSKFPHANIPVSQ